MNILLLNDTYRPLIDGVSLVVENYAYWLKKMGSDVSVVTANVPGYKDSSEIPVYRYSSMKIPRRPPYRIGIPAMDIPLVKRLSGIHFDLLHSHCPFATGALASAMSARRNIPHITTFHSKYKEDFKRVLHNKSMVDLALKISLEHYKKADYVWVPNESTGETLRSYGYRGTYEVWPNGTDMSIPSEEEYLSYREKGKRITGAPKNVLTLLFVGQHIWEKNTRLIIEALSLLKGDEIPFFMIFVGDGYARKEMEILVQNNKLGNQVKFMGHISERESLKEIYAASDLFVFPSLYDNAPLVLREAAAFGVPSIVASGSNSSKDIIDGRGGFHVQPEKEALASLIKVLEHDRQKLYHAGTLARKEIYKSWEDIAKKVICRYREILDEQESLNK